MNRDQDLRRITARQHGVVARRQLADLGFDKHAVARAVERRHLVRLTERVFRLDGSPDTLAQRMTAATLDVRPGAVALHSAAALWNLPGFVAEPIHVLSSRRPHRGGAHLGRVHSTTHWSDDDVTNLDGIALTTPARTLRDLAGRINDELLSRTCDRMLSQRLLRIEQLHELGARLPTKGGTRGVRALRLLVAARPPGFRPAESNLEHRFEAILRDAGDAPFERQVDLGDDSGWVGRVDFLDRRLRIVVEVQSDLHHTGLVDRTRDEVRLARLRRAGWCVVEVTEHEVWHRPRLVVERVRAARAAQRRRLAHVVAPGPTR